MISGEQLYIRSFIHNTTEVAYLVGFGLGLGLGGLGVDVDGVGLCTGIVISLSYPMGKLS